MTCTTYCSKKTKNIKILHDELEEYLEGAKTVPFTNKCIVDKEEISELEVKTEDVITKEDVMLLITHDGYLKRISMRAFSTLGEGEQTKLKDGDVLTDIYSVTTVDVLLQFTNLGNYIFLPIHKIPESKHKDLGYHVSTLISMEPNEKIIFSFPVADFDEDMYVLLATKSGLIKRMKISSLKVNRYSKTLMATKLREDDEVVSVDVIKGENTEVIIATNDGYMNRYDAKEISIIEPSSFGVKSIELKSRPKDFVVGAKYVSEKDIILLLTNRGNIKRMRPDEILKGKIDHGMIIYGEILGYIPNSETGIITRGGKVYDYGCEKGENKLMIYRVTEFNSATGKYEDFEITDVVGYTNFLIETYPELADKIFPLQLMYHGPMKDLYPDISTEEHWHENLVLRMKKDQEKFGMDLKEPLCKNKVLREGLVIRIENDPIQEAFKIKSELYFEQEKKDMDKGIVTGDMLEGYDNTDEE